MHCDASRSPSSNHPYRYMQRGDRCERVYIQAVGGTTLALLSFTASLAEFDPQTGRPLPLKWSVPPDDLDVHVRAQSMQQMQRRLFYRMDTLVPKGGVSYRWPTDGHGRFSLIARIRGFNDAGARLCASHGNQQCCAGGQPLLKGLIHGPLCGRARDDRLSLPLWPGARSDAVRRVRVADGQGVKFDPYA